MVPIQFPLAARFVKNVPKARIYAYGSPSKRVREYMIHEVDTITWEYKLSPETLNIPRGRTVEELQIFRLDLKGDELHTEVLRLIDAAIPSQIFFQVSSDKGAYYAASYKRPSEARRAKSVIGDYFYSEWINDEQEYMQVPVSVNLDVLYQNLLQLLIPLQRNNSEEFDFFLERVSEYHQKVKEIERLEKRISNERQFNRRVELNHQLRSVRSELEILKNHSYKELD